MKTGLKTLEDDRLCGKLKEVGEKAKTLKAKKKHQKSSNDEKKGMGS